MSFENRYMSVEQYLRKISGLEKEILLVDHNYVKAWNAHPESHRTKPARLLFMKGLQRYPLSDTNNLNEEVDIETCDEPLTSPFDNPKTRVLTIECERNLRNTQLFKDTDQDDDLDLTLFSSSQRKLYQQVLNVLNGDRLAKLCCSGSSNEPLRRRLAIDKAARQIRQIFGLIFWNMELLMWLHETLLNHSDISTLSTYIDVLQTLKAKVPTLVERVLQSSVGTTVGDAVIQIMKKTWDPVLPILSQNKPKKLTGNPIILICPSSANQIVINAHSQRLRFWHNTMSSMCKVMNVPVCLDNGKSPSSIEEYLEFMMTCIRNKVAELKTHYPNRPLILLGWTVGALIACHIALQEPIDGVICLGFPLTGVNGSRGDLNDPLLDNKVPTLFIVGQNARMCSTDDIEDFRSRMRAETGLVVVGGADDLLRMCPTKMKYECVSQAIVDRCLLDEISEFLLSVVVKLPSTSAKPCAPIKEEIEVAEDLWKPEEEGKRKRRKPREYSPELSPVRKRQRHHSSRQTSNTTKVRLSPSSSETSSCSASNEKTAITKPVKKPSEKRIGRPTAGTWRKRTPGRPITNPNVVESPSKKTPIIAQVAPISPSKITLNAEAKSSLPFSKNILPKKNDPVDVEKAFGSDSSFLPRPLTPPEPEDTVSAEETERAMAELEAMSGQTSTDSPQVPSLSNTASSLLGDAISSNISFLPISEMERDNKAPATHPVSISVTTIPNVISATETKTTVSISLTPSLQSVLAQSKMLTSSSLKSLKNAGGISLLASNSGSTGSSKSTIITVPSASAASILVSGSGLRTQSGKMIQLIAKGGSPLTCKSTTVLSTGTSATKESSEQTPCNLSLLSDVAGMTEPIKNSTKKAETSSPSATLVKLAVPDRGPFQAMKCLKVIKTVRAPSPPTRVETAEELVEKQLAIQALNKSIGIESSGNIIKEPGYSICYAKADGSIVSRSVTRPNYSGFVTIPPTITPQNRGRGRGRPPFHSKPFRFSNM